MGAVLYQLTPEGNRSIISYASAKFTPTEAKYHSNEQECLAVVWALKKYRPYIEDRPLKRRTDNKGLTWLRTAKNSKDKLRRWALLLQEFNPTIEHCPGRENQLADFLSRNPEDDMPEDLDNIERMLPPTPEPEDDPACCVIQQASPLDDIREAQLRDPACVD